MSKAKDRDPKRAPHDHVKVRVKFVGAAATTIRALLERGLDGPTLELVVEGLALAEVRRRMTER